MFCNVGCTTLVPHNSAKPISFCHIHKEKKIAHSATLKALKALKVLKA